MRVVTVSESQIINYTAQYDGKCNKVIQAQKKVNFAGDSGRCLMGCLCGQRVHCHPCP